MLEHFANPAQIMPTEGAEVVEGCEVRFCHGTGIGSRVMLRNYVPAPVSCLFLSLCLSVSLSACVCVFSLYYVSMCVSM